MTQFIETQFPIARLSAEAYKERKSNNGQTLTRLGKWWGRKPLILVRAAILGMLMPASADPRRDREIFLKLLTMDDAGTWERCKPSARRKTTRTAFDALPYAERIADCERPENVAGPSEQAWSEINAHLGTSAQSLPQLVDQLGQRLFGHTPRVGDSFCGGGSIPFEAARIGCEAFGSDLNPVAALLTWASLNLLGGGPEVQKEVMRVQADALAAADKQVTEWGIEHNEQGERADAFLYCVEVKPEGCDYFIPLAPSWLIGERSKVVARWHQIAGSDRLQPEIVVVSDSELKRYKNKLGATVVNSRVLDPLDSFRSWSLESLRGPHGLRRWTNEDLVPREGDVFQERLYCIRWISPAGERRYAAPETADLQRESRVLELLRDRFGDWQREGFIPSRQIPVGGDKTDEPIRTRGWTHWHHLFTPRQLLVHGLLNRLCLCPPRPKSIKVACFLGVGRLAKWDARLCQWVADRTKEGGAHTFANQALNTLFSYCTRPVLKLDTAWPVVTDIATFDTPATSVAVTDARDLVAPCDMWITDPPYADAVNYHELADFFLAWYDKQLTRTFPDWVPDSRAQLAVRGDGDDFRRSMVEIYQNLARHMPDNGLQMVMFTHQNPAVWADLGMILWAAGLRATAAWTISTETEAVGIKKGNYVQGTVCLVLRKRLAEEPGFLDEVYPQVEDEVKRQIASMQALDDGAEPNFNDADYQLAAYAAALNVLTRYSSLDGRDVQHEVFAVRERHETSQFQQVIERALQIACDTLIPRGLDTVWRDLTLDERYFLRALDIESRGERRQGMYEELARGFAVTEIRPLLKADKANGARMHTPRGLAGTLLASPGRPGDSLLNDLGSPTPRSARGRSRGRGNSTEHPFARTPLRHLLFAIRETTAASHDPEPGRQYLRDTFGGTYWASRETFIYLLDWLAQLSATADMGDWTLDSESARLLAGRLRNDQA
ncbi:MAG: anti-phage-associated DUF1156 domain-containing protein [Planctomycetaceae bacterium]